MVKIKEFDNLNQKMLAKKYICLNKQKKCIAQIDIDIVKFLDASDLVQVYIIKVLVDKYKKVTQIL